MQSTSDLQKPVWVFLESNGYALLDIHDDMTAFCSPESRKVVYIGKYSLLPEVTILQRYKYPVISIRFIHSNIWIRLVIAHLNGFEIIQLDDIIDGYIHNKKTILANTFLIDNQTPCLFGVDPKTTVLVAALGSQLRLRSLSKVSSEFVPLGSHGDQVKNMAFFGRDSSILITCSEQTCKIWNLNLRHQVHAIQGSKIVPGSFCHHPNESSLIFGTRDGRIISVNMSAGAFDSYEICKLQECKSALTSRSIVVNHQKKFSLADQKLHWDRGYQLNPEISDEVSLCILSLAHVLVSDTFASSADFRPYPRSIFKLVIITSTRVGILNVANRQWDGSWTWPELGLKGWIYVSSAFASSTPHGVNFWIQGAKNEVVFFTIPMANMVPKTAMSDAGDIRKLNHHQPALSLLAREELRSDSVLQRSPAPPRELNCQREGRTFKQNGLLNQPVTFGHSIKSSGYAKQEPRRRMFQPPTSGSRNTRRTKGKPKCMDKLGQVYPKCDVAPNVLCRLGFVDSFGTPIYQIAYSPSGSHVAAALGNSACLVLRCPSRDQREISRCSVVANLPDGDALCGHKNAILSVAWSTNGRLLITGSADRTARLWTLKTDCDENCTKAPPRTVLIMDSVMGGASNGYGEQTTVRSGSLKNDPESPPSQPFCDSIVCAQFHYVDSFIYLVCRNMIRLYSYKVKYPKNVLDKGKVTCYYKLRAEFPIETCNQLTAVSSVNIFYSYLMICAGSDRRLSVLDLNAGRVVLEIEDAHSRNMTGIALNQGSVYSAPTQFDSQLPFGQESTSSYNTYATVAPGDGVRMWDLRDGGNAVMQFVRPDAPYGNIASGQASNPLIPPVTAAFSPCGKQLIVGGRVTPNHPHPVIYDTRRAGSHPLTTLTPNPDKRIAAPTTIVAWHPMRPEVTTGSHDGRLATYTTGLRLNDSFGKI